MAFRICKRGEHSLPTWAPRCGQPLLMQPLGVCAGITPFNFPGRWFDVGCSRLRWTTGNTFVR